MGAPSRSAKTISIAGTLRGLMRSWWIIVFVELIAAEGKQPHKYDRFIHIHRHKIGVTDTSPLRGL
jgi:hypothetical protein